MNQHFLQSEARRAPGDPGLAVPLGRGRRRQPLLQPGLFPGARPRHGRPPVGGRPVRRHRRRRLGRGGQTRRRPQGEPPMSTSTRLSLPAAPATVKHTSEQH